MSRAAPRRQTRTAAALSTLRHEIVSGRYRDVDVLPGERDLAAGLAVSRTTLRRMVADLVDEGLLRHRQGIGTFVRRDGPSPTEPPSGAGHPPARLPGFAEDMRSRGFAVTTRDIARSVVLPTPDEAMMLACSPDDPVIRLVRSRIDETQVIAVQQAAVPCRYIDRPESVGASLYASLEQRGHPPVRALQRLQAVTLDGLDAARLCVATGTAGIVVRRTAYLRSGACCEFTRSVYPATLYDVVTETLAAAADGRMRPAAS